MNLEKFIEYQDLRIKTLSEIIDQRWYYSLVDFFLDTLNIDYDIYLQRIDEFENSELKYVICVYFMLKLAYKSGLLLISAESC